MIVSERLILVENEPLVAVTVIVAFVGGAVVGGGGATLPPPQADMPENNMAESTIVRNARRGFFRKAKHIAQVRAAKTTGKLWNGAGPFLAFDVLETVTVSTELFIVAVIVAGLGETLHVELAGAPLQLNKTCPVKLLLPERVTL